MIQSSTPKLATICEHTPPTYEGVNLPTSDEARQVQHSRELWMGWLVIQSANTVSAGV